MGIIIACSIILISMFCYILFRAGQAEFNDKHHITLEEYKKRDLYNKSSASNNIIDRIHKQQELDFRTGKRNDGRNE